MRDDRTYPTEPYMPQNPDSNVGDEYIVKKNPNLIEIPDNATNGDMVKLIFGITSADMKWKCRGQKWWNTPYKKREGD